MCQKFNHFPFSVVDWKKNFGFFQFLTKIGKGCGMKDELPGEDSATVRQEGDCL